MLEYFTYKKIKKHRTQKEVEEEAKRKAEDTAQPSEVLAEPNDVSPGAAHNSATPTLAVLRPEDESFLEELLDDISGPTPPLPPWSYTDDSEWPSDSDMASPGEPQKHDVDGLGEEVASKPADKKTGRLAMLFTRARKNEKGLKPHSDVPQAEGERETKDLSRVLDRLNLSARNNKVVSTDSSQLLQRFTQVFKDLVNGVPTAYDDLAKLIEDRDGTLARGFDKLPSSLKKFVMQLPEKITGSLGPEILAAAAGSQGIKTEAQGGIKGVAKNILMPHNLAELVTKPGAIVGMLRAIVEVLKTR